jgi:hypothetical protein
MAVDFTRDVLIRWDNPEPAHIALLKQAGVSAAIPSTPSPAFREACSAAGIATIAPAELPSLKLVELHAAGPGATVALAEGLWPGIRRPPAVAGRGDETASASREPWVDSNGYWIGYLRALYPNRPALLGYLPDKLEDRIPPFDSLELALIEAWTAGGNYVLSLEKSYREALLRNDEKARIAWEQLGRTARWLRENIALFRQSNIPIVTALVDQGAASAEIGNLLYRRNASPALVSAAAPPPPDPHLRLAIVAANLKQPDAQLARKILAHAEAGGIVVAAALPSQAWWKVPALKPVRSEPDRDFFSLGTGQVIAYKRPIADPSEFALDVIDLVTHKRRAVRLWNGPSVIALATSSPRSGERLLHLVNYGSPIDMDVQARVQGHFTNATLLRPDASPMPLQAARRGSTTEVQVPALRRLGVVVFS